MLNSLFVKIPKWIQRKIPTLVFSISTSKKKLYLTFDDGPTTEITEWVLQQLKIYNAKATFFCIGKNINNHPEIFDEIIDGGHRIGNHTQNHLKGWKTKNEVFFENITATEKILLEKGVVDLPKLFRPPYGKIKPSQVHFLKGKNYKIIMWDVLSLDFDKNVKPEKCLQNVLKNAENGSIIVFHDSVKASEKMMYVLPKILEYYSKKGYRFCVIP